MGRLIAVLLVCACGGGGLPLGECRLDDDCVLGYREAVPCQSCKDYGPDGGCVSEWRASCSLAGRCTEYCTNVLDSMSGFEPGPGPDGRYP